MRCGCTVRSHRRSETQMMVSRREMQRARLYKIFHLQAKLRAHCCGLYTNLVVVTCAISCVQIPGDTIGRVIFVWICKKIVDAFEDLHNVERSGPALVRLQNGQTNAPIVKDIGMEDNGVKFGLRGIFREVTGEFQRKLVDPAFPRGAFFSGEAAFPLEEILRPVGQLLRSCEETFIPNSDGHIRKKIMGRQKP